jgi:hypothetical protein
LRDFVKIKTSDIIFSPNCAYEHTSNFCGSNSATRSSVTSLVTKLLYTTEKASCQLDKRQAGARNKHCNFFSREG